MPLVASQSLKLSKSSIFVSGLMGGHASRMGDAFSCIFRPVLALASAAACLVKPADAADVKVVYYGAHQADRVVRGYVLIDSFRKKNRLIWRIRAKMVLLHNLFLVS